MKVFYRQRLTSDGQFKDILIKFPLKLSSWPYLLQNWQVYDQVKRENLLFRHEKQSWKRSTDEKEKSDGICQWIIAEKKKNHILMSTFPFLRAV